MDEEEAISYLQRKGEISPKINPKFTKRELDKIEIITRKGKIYGDPLVEIEK